VARGDLLRKRKDTVIRRWVEAVLSTYPEDAAALFIKEQDPFANPVGKSVREGIEGLFEAMVDEMDEAGIRKSLDQIVRVRAVQQFSPSQAVAFVFSLKPILRDLFPESEADPGLARRLAEMGSRVDAVALIAFDLHSECREELSQLRINEAKRQVAWVLEKINKRDAVADDAPAHSG
jgi:hypothetical protein